MSDAFESWWEEDNETVSSPSKLEHMYKTVIEAEGRAKILRDQYENAMASRARYLCAKAAWKKAHGQ